MGHLKIIDCFIFFNEIKLLQFRLEELKGIVDYFVIVESNLTFSGQTKPFYFESNQHLFSDILDKVIYIKVEDMPDTDNPWKREEHQRNCIQRGLHQIDLFDEDIILLSDVDEIPDTDRLDSIKRGDIYYYNPIRLKQDMYYYNFNCVANKPTTTSLLIEYKNIKNFENINQIVRTNWYPIAHWFGWHLSYFGDTDYIIQKIKAFSHQEFNTSEFTNPEKIQTLIDNCQDLFQRKEEESHDFKFVKLKDNYYLPKNYQMLLTNEK